MSNNENVALVALEHGEKYLNIEKRFLDDMGKGQYENSRSVKIIKIERIQNKTQYKQYTAKKMMMGMRKPGFKQKGRLLWHETAEKNILWIINNGFNRSYCGVHEVKYGQGVYFAAHATYAAQSYLAENQPGAKRYMFLAKVLTGKLVKGNPSMRVLPPVNPAEPTIIYDSAVDDVNEPSQFVIFHDKHAYP